MPSAGGRIDVGTSLGVRRIRARTPKPISPITSSSMPRLENGLFDAAGCGAACVSVAGSAVAGAGSSAFTTTGASVVAAVSTTGVVEADAGVVLFEAPGVLLVAGA